MFLVYELESFKNCKEVKNIMIMIIDIIYITFTQRLSEILRET